MTTKDSELLQLTLDEVKIDNTYKYERVHTQFMNGGLYTPVAFARDQKSTQSEIGVWLNGLTNHFIMHNLGEGAYADNKDMKKVEAFATVVSPGMVMANEIKQIVANPDKKINLKSNISPSMAQALLTESRNDHIVNDFTSFFIQPTQWDMKTPDELKRMNIDMSFQPERYRSSPTTNEYTEGLNILHALNENLLEQMQNALKNEKTEIEKSKIPVHTGGQLVYTIYRQTKRSTEKAAESDVDVLAKRWEEIQSVHTTMATTNNKLCLAEEECLFQSIWTYIEGKYQHSSFHYAFKVPSIFYHLLHKYLIDASKGVIKAEFAKSFSFSMIRFLRQVWTDV